MKGIAKPSSLLGGSLFLNRALGNDAALCDLIENWQRDFSLHLVVTDPNGVIRLGAVPECASCLPPEECAKARQFAIQEALRWGEPCVSLCPHGSLIWGVPLMVNQKLTGGVVVAGLAVRDDSPEDAATGSEIRALCRRLQEDVEALNLTNSALLAQRRREAGRERERAEAIHVAKEAPMEDLRRVWLREEPELLAAIRSGNLGAGREVLNRVLVILYHAGTKRPELLKSFALELVVMMTRTAVECGADANRLLGGNYSALTHLAYIKDDEELCHWLTGMLEKLMESIQLNRAPASSMALGKAFRFMELHLGGKVSRNRVAAVAGLSVSHFSHLIREKTGRTFNDWLTQYRVDRASHLLRHSDKDLVQIALECGFPDQSYFTKVFRKYTGTPPRVWRQRQQ